MLNLAGIGGQLRPEWVAYGVSQLLHFQPYLTVERGGVD